jgi:hypothetical protein
MHQTLSSLFFKSQGSSSFSDLELSYSNLSSDPSLYSRSLYISPLSPSFSPFTLTAPLHSTPITCSHPVLLSSKSAINSTLTISSVTSTITPSQETRLITFLNTNQPKLKPYIGNSYTYQIVFPFDGSNILKFPNESVVVTSGFDSNNTPVTYTLPNYKTGCKCSVSVTDTTKSISSIAWGLILAAATDSDSLVISTLNGLINSFIDNQSLSQTDGGVVINSFLTPLSNSIYDNSLLGLSVCLSLQYLTSKSNLHLAINNFYEDCIQLARLLSFISSQYVNPVNNFVYGSFSDEGINTEDLSFITSCVTSLFFNSFLSIDYDSIIHYKAAKLYLAILELPVVPDILQYSIFSDSSTLSTIAYKLWWHCEFDLPRAPLLLTSYNSSRLSTLEGTNSTYTELDFLVASLTNLYLFDFRPTWVFWLFEQFKLDSQLKSVSTLNINSLTPIVCYSFKFKLISNYVFDTGATSCRAYSSYIKNLFILSLPEGPFWSSRTNEENSYTTIGSLIHAYSSAFFYITLHLFLLKQPLFSSSSYILRRLASFILKPSVYLAEPLIKSYISILLDATLNPIEKLNLFFKSNFTRYFDTVPNYKILLDRQTKTYTTDITVYNHEFLTGPQYQSIVFYPVSREINTQASNALALRTTPGLPYSSPKTSPAPGTSPSPNESNTHILPLSNLTGLVNLTDNIPAPNNLHHITTLVAPAGVIYKYSFHYFNTVATNYVISSFSTTVSIGAKISVGSTVFIV